MHAPIFIFDNKNSDTRAIIEDKSFYIAFILFTFWAWLNNTTLIELFPSLVTTILETGVQLVVLFLLSIRFLSQKATRREWFAVLFLLLLSLVVWRMASQGWLLWLSLFILCGKDIDIKRLASILFYEMVFLTSLVFFLSALGLTDDTVFVRNDGSIRHSMGFIHPNLFGAALLIVCISYAVRNYPKRIFSTCLIFIICSVLASITADSRTTSTCMLLGAVLFVVAGFIDKFGGKRLFIAILAFALLALLLVSVYLTVAYDPNLPFHSVIDRLLSGRPYYMHLYYLDHAPGLLGYSYVDGTKHIVNGEAFTFIVDNVFSNILLRYGIISFMLLFGSVFLLFWRSYKANCLSPILLGIWLFMVFGFAESMAARIECNYLLLGLSTIVFSGSSDGSIFDKNMQCGEPLLYFKDYLFGYLRFRGRND